jgi:phosphoribosylaminoimidazole-succinocarboxamide synthase
VTAETPLSPGGQPLTQTALSGLTPYARGKVRDLYLADPDHLLIVATDRISAFDVVLPTPIPDKGRVLNQLSAFWFQHTAGLVPNHLVTIDVDRFPGLTPADRDLLAGRSMLVRHTQRIDVECVARGYLAGTAWAEYRRQGTAGGIGLPAGLVESQALERPIFTPAIKAASGHDENITFDRLVALVGEPLAERLQAVTLAVYEAAASYARGRGIIIADTKLEFGLLPVPARGDALEGQAVLRNAQDGTTGTLMLIDELLTPDSSRFWEATAYRPGTAPPSYDKQYVRDYLEGTGWSKEPPAPELPPAVVARTREKYVDALRRLTGRELA